MTKISRTPLYHKVKDKLLNMIEENYDPGDKLPSEEKLRKQFGVSRSTIREGLSLLEHEGIIEKKHGKGNFVKERNERIYNHLSNIVNIPRIIEDHGYEVKVKESDYYSVESDFVARKLNSQNNYFILLERVFTADDVPAIYCKDFIPQNSFEIELMEELDVYNNSLIDFFKNELNIDFEHLEGELLPVEADSIISEKLEIELNSLLIQMQQITYIDSDTPFIYSDSYNRNDLIKICYRRT